MKILDLFSKEIDHSNIFRPYFIAEAGVNHEGDLEIAKQLIYEAAEGGANAIKFQTYKAETIASKDSPSYWDTSKEPTKSQYQLFKKYDKFWKKDFEQLKIWCDQADIEFMSTPFDIESANFLNEMMDIYKISSSDITNKPFIESIANFKKPIILSTGASSMQEIRNAVAWIDKKNNMDAIFDTIINKVPYPNVDPNSTLQMQISALSYSSYVGLIGTGRIRRGHLKKGQNVSIGNENGNIRHGKVLQIMNFHGLEKKEVDEANAGDIVAISGLGELKISDTICEVGKFEALEKLSVDEPTINMMIQVNDSPFAGQEGKLVTSRSIRERLDQELKTNVALRVEDTDNPDKFRISGRGELHLSILIENMRREGFEMGISSPEVITKVIDNVKNEPFENLTIDIEEIHQGKIMEKLGERKAQLIDMVPDSKGRVRVDYIIASRGLIGFRTEFLTLTSGSGLMYHTFDKYRPVIEGLQTGRRNGALISIGQGKALPYALFNLQDRGKMIIKSGIEVYEGMIIGIHSRNNDLVVNPLKGKQLTNVRASGNDDAVLLTTPINVTLEFALEFINNDELIEVTPISLRIRKRFLKEHERKKAARAVS